jgi:hypothetical protein
MNSGQRQPQREYSLVGNWGSCCIYYFPFISSPATVRGEMEVMSVSQSVSCDDDDDSNDVNLLEVWSSSHATVAWTDLLSSFFVYKLIMTFDSH